MTDERQSDKDERCTDCALEGCKIPAVCAAERADYARRYGKRTAPLPESGALGDATVDIAKTLEARVQEKSGDPLFRSAYMIAVTDCLELVARNASIVAARSTTQPFTDEELEKAVAIALCKHFYVGRSFSEYVAPGRELWQRYTEDAKVAVGVFRSATRTPSVDAEAKYCPHGFDTRLECDKCRASTRGAAE